MERELTGVRLTTKVHDRGGAGLVYVYPVVSRRARGVSVGVNLNPNAACNWRCVYCQVPGLTWGKGPPIDLALLGQELELVLAEISTGDYLLRSVPEDSRRLNDVAFSGNGEPTSSPQFAEAVELARATLAKLGLAEDVSLVLITNGSLVHEPSVQRGLSALARGKGEVWFKLDRATDEGTLEVNSVQPGVRRHLRNLALCARLAPTWIQTCLFARRGAPPDAAELESYLAALAGLVRDKVPLQGVLLYGIERASHQPEAAELSKLSPEWLEAFGARIAATGLSVRVHP